MEIVLKIVLISFYNPNWQIFTHFYNENSHVLAFSSLLKKILLQNAGIFGVLKNRELQIRETQGRELQGLPVYTRFINKTFFHNNPSKESILHTTLF